ncbi:MAG: glycosyltransferase family 2 protein [Bacteroidota bacterium]
MPKLTVIILTFNEAHNILACLDSVQSLDADIFVVDSYSTDDTLQLITQRNIPYVQHPFENYARQRNWAQENLPIQTDWVLHLDAGERCSVEMIDWLNQHFDPNTSTDAYLFSRRTFFMNRWMKRGGHYPNFHLRLYRKTKGHCENKAYDQHYVVDGKIEQLAAGIDLIDVVCDSLHQFTIGHARWAQKEALEQYSGEVEKGEVQAKASGNAIERQRWLKNQVFGRFPLFWRALLYFMYRYFIRLGFLDGKEGLIFHTLQAFWFRFLIDAMIVEQRLDAKDQ